jgi:hypothetical protein
VCTVFRRTGGYILRVVGRRIVLRGDSVKVRYDPRDGVI